MGRQRTTVGAAAADTGRRGVRAAWQVLGRVRAGRPRPLPGTTGLPVSSTVPDGAVVHTLAVAAPSFTNSPTLRRPTSQWARRIGHPRGRHRDGTGLTRSTGPTAVTVNAAETVSVDPAPARQTGHRRQPDAVASASDARTVFPNTRSARRRFRKRPSDSGRPECPGGEKTEDGDRRVTPCGIGEQRVGRARRGLVCPTSC
jgi:hypothetical protein